jgi:hypothetical protein
MLRIAPTVETGNYHNPRFFRKKEQPVRKPVPAGPPASLFETA